MKKIDYSNLQPGDILLTTSRAPESWSVRCGTKSDISHAMLYAGSSSAIDSTSDGVHARNLQKMFYEDDCAVYALRPITPLSPVALDAVIEYARQVTGTPYALREAVRSAGKAKGTGSDKQFCSRLVARAYAAAGIQLVDNPDFCTPEELKTSPLLQHLPNPAIEVSADEVAEIKSRPDRVAGMIEVTNNFLEQVRSFDPKILRIEDAFEFLIANRRLDDQLWAALKTSGYLDYWRGERQEFCWRYDFEAMLRFADELNAHADVTSYCHVTLRDHAAGAFEHWEKSLSAARVNARAVPLRSFEAMVTLYENLVEGARLRVTVAEQWLALQNAQQ
ncbi:hypothetical protein H5407_08830 [Mitsuaria sp. WAJ17]|uniref:YiiX/YebB-like N1pC/P60 family cysteine hydrolase n=1 Tax=Mitsuaria sp. WAJ17 TaxID=2761452 RepID=UPI001603268C|nr:YiiX/YebB-like N1pC/P60 family cysteine hydrolase [Mitsuaria sp. WAJ17]MBB2485331.1 hypothetical protein [Mitsuaria sp. WAJ17]